MSLGCQFSDTPFLGYSNVRGCKCHSSGASQTLPLPYYPHKCQRQITGCIIRPISRRSAEIAALEGAIPKFTEDLAKSPPSSPDKASLKSTLEKKAQEDRDVSTHFRVTDKNIISQHDEVLARHLQMEQMKQGDIDGEMVLLTQDIYSVIKSLKDTKDMKIKSILEDEKANGLLTTLKTNIMIYKDIKNITDDNIGLEHIKILSAYGDLYQILEGKPLPETTPQNIDDQLEKYLKDDVNTKLKGWINQSHEF